MCATIAYGNNLLEITDFMHYPEEVKRGNPYNCTFNLKVISGVFSGIAPCEYDIKEFQKFILELEEMYQFKRATTELKDICYGTNVLFSMDKLGHFEMAGTIYGEAMEHEMKFEFHVDQTVIWPFVNELKDLVRESC